MPGFRVYMFGSSPFPVPAAEVEVSFASPTLTHVMC